MKIQLLMILTGLILLSACQQHENGADAYGNFETTETIVSSEANGKILKLDVEEGIQLAKGQLVGLIDSSQLHLSKLKLKATINAVRGKTQDLQPEIDVLNEQKRVLLKEKDRVEGLLKDNAATQKQLDDIDGQLEVIDRQATAIRSRNKTANRSVLSEIEPLEAQIKLVEDQLSKCYVKNPIEGTVLLKLAEESEVTAMGKPLYKIADLSEMILRAYITGTQLAQVKIGQKVRVFIDENEDAQRELEGTISWISSKAEFAPKIVQTKEQRVNLVYAMKVKVKNDGSLKIGMPAEVRFINNNNSEE